MDHYQTEAISCQGQIPERPSGFSFKERWQHRTCGCPMLFQKIEDPATKIFVAHGCKKSSCPDCRPDWEDTWMRSTMRHWGFLPLTDDDGLPVWTADGETIWMPSKYAPVYCSTVRADEFEPIRRLIRSNKHDYMLIRPDNASGDLILFTNEPIGTRVRKDAAPEVLKRAILMASASARSIRTSRGWALPPRKRTRKWQRVIADVRVAVSDLSRALKKWRKVFRSFGHGLFQGVAFSCQPHELERLVRWLECGVWPCLREGVGVVT